ncbi:MAG TPA: sialidase family protein [Terriglobales bacterium]|nr:sialidase family protein [Terriglobales bacterium]
MRPRLFLPVLVGLSVAMMSLAAPAQVDSVRFNALKTRLQQLADTYHKMPVPYQRLMSGNSNAVFISSALNRIQPQMLKKGAATRPALAQAIRAATAAATAAAAGTNPTKVNDPSTDLNFSAFAGFTQSETSTGLCGSNAVVGFNDSGSFADTLINGTGGFSFSGVAVSHNRGGTFQDLGPVPPGPNVADFIIGDPVIACTDPSTFYYSQLLASADAGGNPLTGLAFSSSTDGGNTWSDPSPSILKDGFAHSIDKDWMAIDPSNRRRVYVSYTDFDDSGFNVPVPPDAACPNDFRIGVEVVSSHDGGRHWGKPVVVDQICGFADALQASHVVVDSKGMVHVAWVYFNNFPFGPRELRVSGFRSGNKPSAYVVADGIVGGGDTYYLQGEFRDFLGLDFAVDTSGTATDGTLYLTWDDGRDKVIPDLFGLSGTYAFDDILARASVDGGASWGLAPVKVNSDNQPRVGYGHDHYQPGVAVDSRGNVAICWYDRRADSQNFTISRYCAESAGGGPFNNFKVNISPYGPNNGIDGLLNPVYMGDYDGLTTDFTRSSPGFIGAFQVQNSNANPDVRAYSFQ